jgi:hypothetical protein
MLKYLQLDTLCDATFVFFLISWLVTRQVLYFRVAWSVTFEGPALTPFLFVSPLKLPASIPSLTLVLLDGIQTTVGIGPRLLGYCIPPLYGDLELFFACGLRRYVTLRIKLFVVRPLRIFEVMMKSTPLSFKSNWARLLTRS